MSGVRDPAFWKRFSTAVHLDEESGYGSPKSSAMSASSSSIRPELKHQDSWLGRQQKKKARRTCICWSFWFGLLAVSAIIVVVVLWLLKNGYFEKLKDKIEGM